MYALSARSGLADKRPHCQDNNIWKQLIDSRRGYIYSAKILARILGLLRKNDCVSHTEPNSLSPYQKGLWAIFAAASFQIEEVNYILFLWQKNLH